MSDPGPSVRSLQGRSAAARRWDSPNKDEIAREYAEARLAAYIEEIVAKAPPFTIEQRARIAGLLRGSSKRTDAA